MANEAVRVMTPTSASRPNKRTGRANAPKGFTLLEILLVLTIIGIASILVAPNLGNLEARSFSTQIRQANTLINYARRMAVVRGQPASIEFYAVSKTGDERVPSRTSVGSWHSGGAQITFIDSTDRETEVDDTIEITFFPEGGSTGGTLILALGERRETIEIDPFTGRVSNRDDEND